jgi:hypothetical protein
MKKAYQRCSLGASDQPLPSPSGNPPKKPGGAFFNSKIIQRLTLYYKLVERLPSSRECAAPALQDRATRPCEWLWYAARKCVEDES